jgi:hypothetical protein
MAAAILDNMVFSQMAAIAECLCGQIAENELPPLCFCGIIAGETAYDATGIGEGCDEDDDDAGCGQAWVRLVAAYPSSNVGQADVMPGNCGNGFGFDLEVGILRCIRIEEEGGVLPAEEMLEAVQLQIADMLTMQQALKCCGSLNNEDFVLGQYAPIGPMGGLVGGTWLISIGLV